MVLKEKLPSTRVIHNKTNKSILSPSENSQKNDEQLLERNQGKPYKTRAKKNRAITNREHIQDKSI